MFLAYSSLSHRKAQDQNEESLRMREDDYKFTLHTMLLSFQKDKQNRGKEEK
nr:MAG TPA: hypothetical protein [Bacteriophage sp.]